MFLHTTAHVMFLRSYCCYHVRQWTGGGLYVKLAVEQGLTSHQT